jgi:hypothetical protein
MKRELVIPPDAEGAEQAVELFRGWIIDGGFQCSLFPTVWEDELGSWGQFLADGAIHVSNAIAEKSGRDPRDVLAEIARAFFKEVSEPTGIREGEYLDRDG